MTMHVTNHAVQRYQERVEDIPTKAVRQRLTGKAFDTAETFGAKVVILPTGQRAVICDKTIVTILPKGARCG